MLYPSLMERSLLAVTSQWSSARRLINIISVCNCHLFALSVCIFHVLLRAAVYVRSSAYGAKIHTRSPSSAARLTSIEHVNDERHTERLSEYFAPREDLKKSGVSGGMNFKKWLCWRPEECPAVNSWTAEETNSTCEHSNKAVLLCYSTSLGVYVRAWLFTPQTPFFPGCIVGVQ